jgi:hypothetical protein
VRKEDRKDNNNRHSDKDAKNEGETFIRLVFLFARRFVAHFYVLKPILSR